MSGDGRCARAENDETRVGADELPSSLHQERSSGATPSPLHVVDFELPA